MITLCTVTLNTLADYEAILIESILKHCKIINEVILADNNTDPSYSKEWTEGRIRFKKVGSQEFLGNCCGDEHALGLCMAIDHATNDTVYLCDPDVFFLSDADRFFYNLKVKHNLDVIGCSHHSAAQLSGTFFPWHGAVMMNKKKMPGKDWLPGEVRVPGKWLLPGVGEHQKELFPNPSGNFDTACGMWLWAKQQNWKWLSFQTTDAHLYTTRYFRGNWKMTEKLPYQELIYHAVSGSIEKEAYGPFKAAYERMKGDE